MALCSEDPLEVAEASIAIRKILSVDRNPPIAKVLEAGILPRLKDLLCDDSRPNVQLEVCWALTNIASGTREQTQAVVECGAVPLFVRLLSSPDACLQEQAVWALANIAGDRVEYRDGCISVGTVEALCRIVESSLTSKKSVQMTRLSIWGLSNMCRGRPAASFEKVSHCLPFIGRAVAGSNDSEVLADSAWALSYLTDSAARDNLSQVLLHVDLDRLISLLAYPSSSVHTPVLRVVGNLVSGESEMTDRVVSKGVLNHLKMLLLSNKKSVRKESLWAVSNICADSDVLIQKVIDSGILQRVCDLLKESDSDIKTEAAWVVCNACTAGNASQIRTLVMDSRFKVIELLVGYLESACREKKSVTSVLDAIFSILRSNEAFTSVLEECGGLTLIEDLQQDESEEIYASAVKILETYFDCEQEGTENRFFFNFSDARSG